MPSRIVPAAVLALAFISLTSGQPHVRRVSSNSAGEIALATARKMVGRPYKYSGETYAGFDCSGLVRYSYRAAGMDLPHETRELKQLAHVVSPPDMKKGDLLFFKQYGKNYSHVGIYAGNNRFVHAPRPGKCVRIDTLLDPYWKEHFLDARRF